MTGIRTPDIPLAGLIDDVVGNYNDGTGSKTVRVKTSVLSAVLSLSGGTAFATWGALASRTGTTVGQRADVFGDTGSHIDPATGISVINHGIYSWTGTVWTRVSDNDVVGLETEITAEIATRAAADTALQTNINGEASARTAADANLQTQINGLAAPLFYDGTWNASTNSPALTSGVGVAKHYRVVSAAGTTNLDGIATWNVGDLAIFNGSAWERASGVSSLPTLFFTQDGTGAAPRSASAEFKDVVKPEQYGAVGDGVASDLVAYDNSLAWAASASLPVRLDRKYNLGLAITPIGPGYVDNSPYAELGGAANLADTSLLICGWSALPVKVNAGGVTYTYTLSPEFRKSFDRKALWLNFGDLDDSTYKAIDATTMQAFTIPFPGSDTWTPTSFTAANPNTFAFTIGVIGAWYAGLTPIRGGQELSCVFQGAGSGITWGAIVRTTKGYGIFYATDSGAGEIAFKIIGSAITTATADWEGRTISSWSAINAQWTIRVYDHKTWAVLLNGVEIVRQTVPAGEIYMAGFGMYSGATGVSGNCYYLTRAYKSVPDGLPPVRLSIWGDSKSSPFHGVWSDAFREALDGSLGIRVVSIVNNAIAGQTSSQQLTAMTASGVGNATDVIVHIGTNDIQQAASELITVSNLSSMLSIVAAAGARMHLVIPDMWYTPAQSGQGSPTFHFDAGARTREAMLVWAAVNNINVIDLTRVLGPVFGAQVSTPDASDYRLRDNIHPTSFSYRVIGRRLAQAVLTAIARKMTPAVPETQFDSTIFQNGWTGDPGTPPTYRVTDDGAVHLAGQLNAGTITYATPIYQLPPNLSPSTFRNIPIGSGTQFAVIGVTATGIIQVQYAPPGTTTLFLDGIVFDTGTI